jgi:kinesin family protein 2/24
MLLAYGQTGSGKTYTVAGLERLLVDKLIDGQVSGKKEVRVCIFEVFGSNMFGKQYQNPEVRVLIHHNRSPE